METLSRAKTNLLHTSKSFYSRSSAALSAYSKTNIHAAGKRGLIEGFGLGKGQGLFSRGLNVAFMGFAAYQGYQEGGALGAATGVASSAALNYAFGAGMKALGMGGLTGAVLLPLGAAAAGGMAYVGAKRAASEHQYRHQRLELGSPLVDDFGTVSTMRQRSLQAIQNSRLNGRTALGNEAVLMYRPY